MSWAKIDDRFLMNPKVMSAGLEGRALYLAGILYCAGELTDGKIPAAAVRKLAALSDVEDSDLATQKLLNLNLWEKDAETGGYQIHDYHDYNPAAKEAKEHKQNVSQKRSEAGSKGASARWQNDGKSDGKNMAPREDGKTIAPSPSPSSSSLRSEDPPNPPGGGSAGEVKDFSEPEAETEPEESTEDAKKPPVRSPLLLRFDRFYAAYPKKRSPADAEKAWRKLRPDEDTLNEMLIAIEWQKVSFDWTKDRGQYIPLPATYLNRGDWRDEPPEGVRRQMQQPAAPPPKRMYRIEDDPDYQRRNATSQPVQGAAR